MSGIDFYEDGVHMEQVGADTKCSGSDLSSRVVRRLELFGSVFYGRVVVREVAVVHGA